jgi:MFS family permease
MLALGTIGTCAPTICFRPSRLEEQNQSAALKDFHRRGQAALYTLARLSPFWSLAQGVGGLCTNFTQFVWARIFLGIGEAPHYPTSARVVTNWFAPRDRGVPVGLFNAASPLGTALAPPLLTFLMLTFNWRWMFVAMGAVGLIGAVVWILAYRDPNAAGLSPSTRLIWRKAAVIKGRQPLFRK